MDFDKSAALFPCKAFQLNLAHCGVSPLYSAAAARAIELLQEQMHYGGTHFMDFYEPALHGFKTQAAALLHSSIENIAAVRNTSEALSMLANGYPFQPGDEIITFTHEYPANFYPWFIQEARGVIVKQLPNHPGRPDISPELVGRFLLEDLEKLITPRTRIIALSHVQFTSGFAADLKAIGALCKAHHIDFIVDVAQSLGSMPVYPESWNIAAVASAGWKWLLGPMGSGVFYTSSALREKLSPVLVGAETMTQGFDYLDHRWTPHHSAKRFEYSTSSISHVAALEVCMRDVQNHYGIEAIFAEIQRLQSIFLEELNHPALTPLVFEAPHRSGILSIPTKEAAAISQWVGAQKIALTARSGFLRIAPHFYNTESEMRQAAQALNAWEAA